MRAADRAEVDRLAAIAREAGAAAFEAPHVCEEYTPFYYAAFFEDADGNKLEICYREPQALDLARPTRSFSRDRFGLHEQQQVVVAAGLAVGAGHVEAAERDARRPWRRCSCG